MKLTTMHHAGCGGQITETDVRYPYEHEDGHVEQASQLMCTKCGKEIEGDPQIAESYEEEKQPPHPNYQCSDDACWCQRKPLGPFVSGEEQRD